MKKYIKDRKGQNTVEYLLMLSAIVGLVLIVGVLMKKAMPGLFGQIQSLISNAASSLGSTGGNSN